MFRPTSGGPLRLPSRGFPGFSFSSGKARPTSHVYLLLHCEGCPMRRFGDAHVWIQARGLATLPVSITTSARSAAR
eukprot:121550-Pyramimonas_sp.AAC.1